MVRHCIQVYLSQMHCLTEATENTILFSTKNIHVIYSSISYDYMSFCCDAVHCSSFKISYHGLLIYLNG